MVLDLLNGSVIELAPESKALLALDRSGGVRHRDLPRREESGT